MWQLGKHCSPKRPSGSLLAPIDRLCNGLGRASLLFCAWERESSDQRVPWPDLDVGKSYLGGIQAGSQWKEAGLWFCSYIPRPGLSLLCVFPSHWGIPSGRRHFQFCVWCRSTLLLLMLLRSCSRHPLYFPTLAVTGRSGLCLNWNSVSPSSV